MCQEFAPPGYYYSMELAARLALSALSALRVHDWNELHPNLSGSATRHTPWGLWRPWALSGFFCGYEVHNTIRNERACRCGTQRSDLFTRMGDVTVALHAVRLVCYVSYTRLWMCGRAASNQANGDNLHASERCSDPLLLEIENYTCPGLCIDAARFDWLRPGCCSEAGRLDVQPLFSGQWSR